MKWLIWGACGLLLALWTGVMAVSTRVLEWAGQSLAGLDARTLPPPPGTDALPSWMAPWWEWADLQAWHAAVQQVIIATQGALPMLGTATGWLEPLAWVVWGLGALALVGGAAGLHGLLAVARRHAGGAVPGRAVA